MPDLDYGRRSFGRGAGGSWVIFLQKICSGGVVFLLGVLRNVAARRGVFVDKMWSNAWQPWTAVCALLSDESHATFQGFFA